ncbi:MAG: hypothetical protein EPO21_18710 [Chloroflexota bacterium]|nr:MAG: hypothetical protein EPO21_18710 [Chloroflexota bacterium]
MMLAKALSCAVVGLEGALVEVEVDIAPGMPVFSIIGLPDAFGLGTSVRSLIFAGRGRVVSPVGRPEKTTS